MILLLSVLAGPAHASDVLELPQGDPQALQVHDLGDRFWLSDGRGRPLTPGEFARRADDWSTYQRYEYELRVTRTASTALYIMGGASVLLGANVVPVLADAYTDSTYKALARMTGVGMVVGGFAALGGGYVVYQRGTRRARDPGHWWTLDQAASLADQHNAGLPSSGLAPAAPLLVQVRPVIGPGVLGIQGRFG